MCLFLFEEYFFSLRIVSTSYSLILFSFGRENEKGNFGLPFGFYKQFLWKTFMNFVGGKFTLEGQ